jgi:hypothetical protein
MLPAAFSEPNIGEMVKPRADIAEDVKPNLDGRQQGADEKRVDTVVEYVRRVRRHERNRVLRDPPSKPRFHGWDITVEAPETVEHVRASYGDRKQGADDVTDVRTEDSEPRHHQSERENQPADRLDYPHQGLHADRLESLQNL